MSSWHSPPSSPQKKQSWRIYRCASEVERIRVYLVTGTIKLCPSHGRNLAANAPPCPLQPVTPAIRNWTNLRISDIWPLAWNQVILNDDFNEETEHFFGGWLQSSTMVQPQAEKSHQWITLLQAMDCGIKKSNWYPSKVDEPLQILHVQRVQPSKNDMYICYIAILQDFDDFDRTLIINPSWYQNISSSTNPLFS